MRKILFLLFSILSSSVGHAQNTLDNLGLSGSVPAASAYSLRLLSSSYAGYAIQVRRSTSNTTQDIGFTANGDLDTAALKTFVGVNDGFVTVWYDQSGNGRNLTQTNTDYQPAIVSSGTIYRRNYMPTLFHDNTNDGLTYSGGNYLTSLPLSVNIVAGSNSSGTSARRAVQGTSNWLIGPYSNNDAWYAEGWNLSDGSSAWSTSNVEVFTAIEPSSDPCTFWKNSVSIASGNSKGVPNQIRTGAQGAYGEPLDGYLCEVLAFNSELSNGDRILLETNQETYYSSSSVLTIGRQPSAFPMTTCMNGTKSLNVFATGSGLTYQWYTNTVNNNTTGTLIPSATSNTYIPTSAIAGDYYYYVVVTDGSMSSVTSNVSGLVTVQPVFTSPITGSTTGTESVLLTASGASSYLWSGGLSTTSAANTFIQTGTYTLTATSSDACVYSTSQNITVNYYGINKYGQVTADSLQQVNKNGAIAHGDALSIAGRSVCEGICNDGSTSSRAGASAYQIKLDYPASSDGLYWIKNQNINGGTPFQIYADMTTDGGGWTLIMTNSNANGWNYPNAVLRNEGSPSVVTDYSIISYADYIKKSSSGFQYMIDATTRGAWGGIWTANDTYSFVSNSNGNTNITLNTKFGTWNYCGSGVEERMPYYSNNNGIVTTSGDPNGDWWGTLVTGQIWTPAPWMACDGNGNPGIIWYWVR